jgi:hypothetical protein
MARNLPITSHLNSMQTWCYFMALFFLGNCTGPAGKAELPPGEAVSIREALLPDTTETGSLTGQALAQIYCQPAIPFPTLVYWIRIPGKRKYCPRWLCGWD